MPVEAMRRLFAVEAGNDRLGNAEPLPSIFPKESSPVVSLTEDGQQRLETAHWGFVLPQTSKKTGEPIQPKAINNARDNNLRTSRFWKASFETRRCLLPATSLCKAKGYNPATYVWFGLAGDGARPPFAFAGISTYYDESYGDEHRAVVTSSMVTSTPNALTRDTHPDRMPVILDPGDYEAWLTGTPDAAFDPLRPFPAERMVIHQAGEGMKSDRAGL